MTTLNDAQCNTYHYDQKMNLNNGNWGTGEYRLNTVVSATIDGQMAFSLAKIFGRLNSKNGKLKYVNAMLNVAKKLTVRLNPGNSMNKLFLLIAMLLLPFGYVAAQSSPQNLKTQSANQLGLTVSGYIYDEPSLSVRMTAVNVGLEYLGTYAFQNDWFLLGQVDYNNGPVKYSGSGTASGIPQYYVNFKAALGHDFAFNGYVLSPYIGFGQQD